jgi:cell division protein FtsA
MVKLRHGQARPAAVDAGAAFAVRPFGQEQTVQVLMADLAAIVEPRVEELFSLVRQEIKRSGYDGLLPAGVVLTGGSSPLPGMRDVAADVLHLPVRSAQPEGVRGLVDQLRSPAFATAFGLLEWGKLQEEQSLLEGKVRLLGLPKLDMRRAADYFRRLLPG